MESDWPVHCLHCLRPFLRLQCTGGLGHGHGSGSPPSPSSSAIAPATGPIPASVEAAAMSQDDAKSRSAMVGLVVHAGMGPAGAISPALLMGAPPPCSFAQRWMALRWEPLSRRATRPSVCSSSWPTCCTRKDYPAAAHCVPSLARPPCDTPAPRHSPSFLSPSIARPPPPLGWPRTCSTTGSPWRG